MDSIILSLAIKLYKKLTSFIVEYQSDIFGVGTQGDVYIGDDDDKKPTGYKMWGTSNNVYTLPITTVPHFNNLVIEEGKSLTADTPYLFLYVRDTLRIKGGASVNLNGKGNNTYTYSPFLERPGVGQSTRAYTAACLKLLLSSRDIRTDLDLSVCGGNAGTIALSGGGAGSNGGGGGGLVCIYHKTNCLKAYNTETHEEQGVEPSFITANGGKKGGGTEGGGMLFIFAKNIVIETDSNQSTHGSISSNGGDGKGLVSYLNRNPSDKPATGNPESGMGGGGVVHHVGLDVI